MLSGMPKTAHLQGVAHPIRAIVFGANVMPITRGVTGPWQSWRSSSKSRASSNVISCQPSAALAAKPALHSQGRTSSQRQPSSITSLHRLP